MALSLEHLPDDVASLKALILMAHAEVQTVRADTARLIIERDQLAVECGRRQLEQTILAAELDRVTAQNERLDHILSVLRRAHFGRSSERISDEQMLLALEDVETACAADDAKVEKKHEVIKRSAAEGRRANRGHLPAHLPREEVVIEPESVRVAVKRCM